MFWCGHISAQRQADDLKIRSLKLEELSKQMLKSTSLTNPQSLNLDQLRSIFNGLDMDHAEEIAHINSSSNAEVKKLRNDLGLNIEAGFLTNFTVNYLDDEDFFYRNRWQGGLSWDLLKDGLLDHRLQAKSVIIKQEKLINTASQEFKKLQYGYTFDFIIKTFSAIKANLLAKRLVLLKEELNLAQTMQNKKLILDDEVLNLESEYSTTRIVLDNYTVYLENIKLPAGLDSLILMDLPIFELEISKILNDALTYATEQKALDLKLINKTKTSVLNQIGVKTFIRYSVFNEDSFLEQDRKYYSAGVSMRVPLPLQLKNHRDIYRLDLENKQNQNDQKYANLSNDIINHYYEYKLHLKQFTSLYYKRLITLSNIERELVKPHLESNDYSPIAIAKYIDHLLSIEIELYEVMQLIYLKALKINTFIPDKNIADYAYPFNPISDQKLNLVNSVVLDNSLIESMPLDVIIRHLKQNKFENVFVEHGPEKIVILQSYFNQKGIKYSIILDNSAWLTMPDGLLLSEINNLEYGNYCLDLEFNEDFGQSMRNWEDKMTFIIQHLKDKGGVSLMIPLWVSTKFVDFLYTNNISMYLKVYEKPDIAYLGHKLSDICNTHDHKFSLILRSSDYENVDEMRSYADKIADKLDINHIVIQDLTTWLKLQFNTIGHHEKH